MLHVCMTLFCTINLQEQEQCAEAEENVQRLMAKKADLESNLQEMVERLDEEVDNNANISAAKRKLEAEMDRIKEDLDDLQTQLGAVEQEKAQKEKDCMGLDAELEKMNDNLSRIGKEKKGLEERLTEVTARYIVVPIVSMLATVYVIMSVHCLSLDHLVFSLRKTKPIGSLR